MSTKEEVYYRYTLENTDIDAFHENTSIAVDITVGDQTSKLVTIINHFLRFISSVGYSIEDVVMVMNALIEAEEEMIEEEEEYGE